MNIIADGIIAIISVSIVKYHGLCLGYSKSRINTENPDNNTTPKAIERTNIYDSKSVTFVPNKEYVYLDAEDLLYTFNITDTIVPIIAPPNPTYTIGVSISNMLGKKIEQYFSRKILNTVKMYVLPEDAHRLEYYEFHLERLEKERNKITQRGRLSEYEDLRLYEIDDETEYLSELINELYSKTAFL